MRRWLPLLARVLEHTLIVAGAALIAHASWEIVQLSLYQFGASGSRLARAAFVIARIRDDIGLSALGFLLSCVMLRDSAWPVRQIRAGVVIMTTFGFVCATAREWLTVHAGVVGYAQGTVEILGVALPPLLQWLIVPAVLARLVVPLIRRARR